MYIDVQGMSVGRPVRYCSWVPFFSDSQRALAEAIDALIYVNPFSTRRRDLERQALGDHFDDEEDAWRTGPGRLNLNVLPLLHRAQQAIDAARPSLGRASPDEVRLYRSLVRYRLYYEHEASLLALSEQARRTRLRSTPVSAFGQFRRQFLADLRGAPGVSEEAIEHEVEHLWAISFQVRRAFEEIFLGIIGASEPAARLRERVWESVFTHDMRRYERSLFCRMHQMNTLIVGPTGTGKELVARAIGLSRYVPFDAQQGRFVEETHESFFALNLSSLASSLVESELFGHKKGSFTGAIQDRPGFLERCPEQGTVFLDEIGELSEELQVKLLRTLQARELRRIGDHETRRFVGKFVSATNRDLESAVREGRLREDFYYRLRADQVETPSLADQLADRPDDLERLVSALCSRLMPEEEVPDLVRDVVGYCQEHLQNYTWPGNVRELEQCILSLTVHGRYHPPHEVSVDPWLRVARKLERGAYSLDELSDLYVTLAHRRYGSYSETARQLELDRRTVRSKVRPELLVDWEF